MDNTITTVLRARSESLHRRRVMGGRKSQLAAALVEVGVLDLYGRGITMDDLDRSLVLRAVDDDGRTLRVVLAALWPARVYANMLDVDRFVFANTTNDSVIVHGWLPIDQIEEAPIVWFERNGERYSYGHEIEQPFLAGMPSAFRFVESCHHLDDFGGIWDNQRTAFECCGCGRFLYDSYEREQWPALVDSVRSKSHHG